MITKGAECNLCQRIIVSYYDDNENPVDNVGNPINPEDIEYTDLDGDIVCKNCYRTICKIINKFNLEQ